MGHSHQKPEHLAAKLLAIRQKLNLSQSELIAKLDCNLSTGRISEYESGTRIPSLLTLLAYSKLARVSVNALIDDKKELPERLKQSTSA
jgi:transcriptional regulator with XRE-family HTH domain